MSDAWGDELLRQAEINGEAARARRGRWEAILAAHADGVVRWSSQAGGRFAAAVRRIETFFRTSSPAPPSRWRPWGGVLVRDFTAEDLARGPGRRGARWTDKRVAMRRWS